MPEKYASLVPALKSALPAKWLGALGRSVEFIERLRKVSAGAFVWAVILSRFDPGKPGFKAAGRWFVHFTKRRLRPRAFQLRFKSGKAVALFKGAFERVVAPWHRARPIAHRLAREFADVVAVDSTLVKLSDGLRRYFKGTRGAKASLKILLTVSIFGLIPLAARMEAGHRHDMHLFPPLDLFLRGTLLLFDKGFVAYARLRRLQEAALYYLCPQRLDGNARIVAVRSAPLRVRKALRDNPRGIWLRDVLPRGKRIGRAWDLDVLVEPKKGGDLRLVRTRLVIVPGPAQEQRPYLTNLAPERWHPFMLRELYRLRWQIELVFKELKQHISLDKLPTKDRNAVQVFAWASLIALAVSRLVSNWLLPLNRLVGMAAQLRPALVTRTLRAVARLLGHALKAAGRDALVLLRILRAEILAEAKRLKTDHQDSFARLAAQLAEA